MVYDKKTNVLLTTVKHIFIFNWIDKNVITPENAQHTLNVIKKIHDIRSKSPSLPVGIHCSAGIGRTGTLIVLFNLYRDFLLQKSKALKEGKEFDFMFSVWNIVLRVRHCRSLLVQTGGQYAYLYKFIEYFRKSK